MLETLGNFRLPIVSGRYFMASVPVVLLGATVTFMDRVALLQTGYIGLLSIAIFVHVIGLIVGSFLFLDVFYNRSQLPALLIYAAVFGCGWVVAPYANEFVCNRSIAAAKAYPETVAPLLAKYRQVHGSYPTQLAQLESASPSPHLFTSNDVSGYQSDGKTYHFRFFEPRVVGACWEYDGEHHIWQRL